MAILAFYGHVPPSDYSAEIRRGGMTHGQAQRLERELVKLRQEEIDLQVKLAKLSAGLPIQ